MCTSYCSDVLLLLKNLNMKQHWGNMLAKIVGFTFDHKSKDSVLLDTT